VFFASPRAWTSFARNRPDETVRPPPAWLPAARPGPPRPHRARPSTHTYCRIQTCSHPSVVSRPQLLLALRCAGAYRRPHRSRRLSRRLAPDHLPLAPRLNEAEHAASRLRPRDSGRSSGPLRGGSSRALAGRATRRGAATERHGSPSVAAQLLVHFLRARLNPGAFCGASLLRAMFEECCKISVETAGPRQSMQFRERSSLLVAATLAPLDTLIRGEARYMFLALVL